MKQPFAFYVCLGVFALGLFILFSKPGDAIALLITAFGLVGAVMASALSQKS